MKKLDYNGQQINEYPLALCSHAEIKVPCNYTFLAQEGKILSNLGQDLPKKARSCASLAQELFAGCPKNGKDHFTQPIVLIWVCGLCN